MPIMTEVYRVLFEGKSAEAATNSLMMRSGCDQKVHGLRHFCQHHWG